MNKGEKLNFLSQNISTFKSRADISLEQRNLTLVNIASILCENHADISLKELEGLYCEIVGDMCGSEKIILYRQMMLKSNLLKKMKESLTLGNEETPAGTHGKISYVKNALNNLAFELFSKSVNNAKPIWESSFIQSCESVADGKSEFCILPTENSYDGKLLGFYSIIDRYDLKICSVCDVEDSQGKTISFALLSKSCKEIDKRHSHREIIFEFSLLDSNCDFMSDLMSAADACGAHIEKFAFIPIQYDSRLKRYIFSVKIRAQELIVFKAFLSLSYHSYTPIGQYIENTF